MGWDHVRHGETHAHGLIARPKEAPWSLGVAEASRHIASGALTPSDLVASLLDRIADKDSALSSFITVMPDIARDEAAKATAEIAERGPRGPLHGIPFGVKDTYDVAGVPTTAASRHRLTMVPPRDAELVARLRSAGAIILGKLATWEYGTGDGGEYFDLPFPPARNPWNLGCFTGGSSTGSGAAVAAGFLPFALGSDTTGSVRLPAGACGVLGLIPTQGMLSLSGVLPNCHSLDRPGLFCRSAEDAALVLDVLVGAQTRDSIGATPASGMRVGVLRECGPGFPGPDEAMAEAFEQGLAVLDGLGVALEDVRLTTPAAECLAITQVIGPAETAAIHEDELRQHPSALGRAFRGKLLAGATVRAVDYLQAQRRRTEIAAEIDALTDRFDALVAFGALHLPPRLGLEPDMTDFTRETMLTPFNLSGHPALVQRTGFSSSGLPTHWQIVASRDDEATALRLAWAFERETQCNDRWPDFPAVAPPPPPLPDDDMAAPSVALRARATRMGLSALDDVGLGRLEAFEKATSTHGAALRRPSRKDVPPAFGMQRPPK